MYSSETLDLGDSFYPLLRKFPISRLDCTESQMYQQEQKKRSGVLKFGLVFRLVLDDE